MKTVFSLPEDVLSNICRLLPVASIASLRQVWSRSVAVVQRTDSLSSKVCHALNTNISGNKQLWATLIEREISSQGIPVTPHRRDLEEASAADVESWFRCAFQLPRIYSTGVTPEVTRCEVNLRITWVKLLKSRWCLAAMSDERESRICVYDFGRRYAAPLLCCTRFLPGPVMDGVVEDLEGEMRIAVSVGTWLVFLFDDW